MHTIDDTISFLCDLVGAFVHFRLISDATLLHKLSFSVAFFYNFVLKEILSS